MRSRGPLLAMIAVGVLGGVVGGAVWGSFSSLISNTSDAYAAGTVYLTDNDADARLISLTAADPADSATSCIAVTYGGTLPSTVELYASAVTGTIAPYVTLTVTRGTDSAPSFPSCSGFTADATDYVGAGGGVVYSGLLSAFPTSYATGLVDPKAGSAATWSTSDVHSYRFTVSLNGDENAQGTAGTADFTWEARNQ